MGKLHFVPNYCPNCTYTSKLYLAATRTYKLSNYFPLMSNFAVSLDGKQHTQKMNETKNPTKICKIEN